MRPSTAKVAGRRSAATKSAAGRPARLDRFSWIFKALAVQSNWHSSCVALTRIHGIARDGTRRQVESRNVRNLLAQRLGMMSQTHALNTIGQNIANVSTGGYKGRDVRFSTLVGQQIDHESDLSGVRPWNTSASISRACSRRAPA